MQEISLTLMHHYGDKGDEGKLHETLKAIAGLEKYDLDLEKGSVLIHLSKSVSIQEVINEINMKTGFKAF